MVGITGNGAVSELIYRAVLRVLHPAESAVRRLIVIAARGLKVELPSVPSEAQDGVVARKGARKGGGPGLVPALRPPQAVQPRAAPETLRQGASPHAGPSNPIRRRAPGSDLGRSRTGPMPVAGPEPAPEPKPDGEARALRIRRRLAAVKRRSSDIPRQAQRMARLGPGASWTNVPDSSLRSVRAVRRATAKSPSEDIDFVLEECHALARDVLNEDTS